MIDLDTSELTALAAELTRVPARTAPKLRASVQASSKNLRDAYRAQAQGHPHAPHFPDSITYETKLSVGSMDGEVGPDKSRPQGALGNILYFGTSNNPPVLDINGPADAAEPTFEQAVSNAVKGVLG